MAAQSFRVKILVPSLAYCLSVNGIVEGAKPDEPGAEGFLRSGGANSGAK
jgi:hypothetical protein